MTSSSPPQDQGTWRDRVAARARWLRDQTAALAIAMRDPRTPWTAKLVAGVTVGYALSPVDLIPDFIPVLGYLDDLLILPALVALAIRLVPREVMADARRRARERQDARGAARWRYAIPIILVWLILLAVAGRIVWGIATR